MKFKDYQTFSRTLKIPIMGKVYEVPEVSAKLGTELHIQIEEVQAAQAIAMENLDAAKEAEMAGEEHPEPKPVPEVSQEIPDKELLGEKLRDELYEDDVPLAAIEMLSLAAYYDFTIGREAAEVFWNSGGDPKVFENYISQLRKSITSGDGENTTPTPDSTSGTKSQKKSSPSTTEASKQSATAKSSKTGGSSKARSKENSK